MPVDQLAMHVLWYLADTGKYHRRVDFILDRLEENSRRGVLGQTTAYVRDGGHLQDPAARAWAEAWEWLMPRRLITEDLSNSDFWIISRHGRRIAVEADPLTHLRSLALLQTDLHPRIAKSVRSLFLQGHYELAAFEAMKQVEIRVRDLAGAGAGDIGVPLMRQAFKPDGGPRRPRPGEGRAGGNLRAIRRRHRRRQESDQPSPSGVRRPDRGERRRSARRPSAANARPPRASDESGREGPDVALTEGSTRAVCPRSRPGALQAPRQRRHRLSRRRTCRRGAGKVGRRARSWRCRCSWPSSSDRSDPRHR